MSFKSMFLCNAHQHKYVNHWLLIYFYDGYSGIPKRWLVRGKLIVSYNKGLKFANITRV